MTFLGWCLSLLGYALTWSLLPIVLLRKKRNPAASIAWMLAILVLPIAGAVLFLLFGVNRVERRKRSIPVCVVNELVAPTGLAHALRLHPTGEPGQRQLVRRQVNADFITPGEGLLSEDNDRGAFPIALSGR